MMTGTIQGATIGSWSSAEAPALWSALEAPNWAPWLAASAETLASRARVFAEGQLLMKAPHGQMMASLSMNRISWDGSISSLPTWNQVAGDSLDYRATYVPAGNTLVLMSMSLSHAYKRLHLPSRMMEEAKGLAAKLGVSHLIGPFRPSGFGEAKARLGAFVDFERYVFMTRTPSSKPVDPWLGSAWHVGMKLLFVDRQAVVAKVSLRDFSRYREEYNPGYWREIRPGVWECGEVGAFTVDRSQDAAMYRESNVWGALPFP